MGSGSQVMLANRTYFPFGKSNIVEPSVEFSNTSTFIGLEGAFSYIVRNKLEGLNSDGIFITWNSRDDLFFKVIVSVLVLLIPSFIGSAN